MKPEEFSNKKVLITNHNLVNFAGSELTTLVLAREFKRLGNDVVIGTFHSGDPIKTEFEKEDIPVIDLLEEANPEQQCMIAQHYDLIWAHHTPVLSDLIFMKNISADRILFSSLSPYEPLEAPPVYTKELSLCLANSSETRDKLMQEGIQARQIFVFPNSVEDSFLNAYDRTKKGSLEKLCIISNHVPEELRTLRDELHTLGLVCDIFGQEDKFTLVDAELIARYDGVITIGKSIQYGLAAGIPAYCYDRFGGPGWITDKNLSSAEYYNFSGRCCRRRLSAEQILAELLAGYEAAFGCRDYLHQYARKQYSIPLNVARILAQIEESPTCLAEIKTNYPMLKRTNGFYEQRLQLELSKEHQLQDLRLTINAIYGSRRWKVLTGLQSCKNYLKRLVAGIFAL